MSKQKNFQLYDRTPWHRGFAWIHILLGGLLATVFIACAPVGPDYQPPHQELPASWRETGIKEDGVIGSEELEHWWTLFNDPQLDSLIRRATLANLDLQVATSRIAQARAQYLLVRGTILPTADVSGNYSRFGSGGNPHQDLFQVGFDAGWEIDIFGGIRRAVESAQANFAAEKESCNDVLISLQAEVARNYLELRGSQQRLTTAEKNLAAQQKSFELARERQAIGLGTGLDVAQAETLLEFNKAQLPALKESAGQAGYRLDLLLGQLPGSLADELSRRGDLPFPPPLLPGILPSELLRSRPDIRRAERQLAAATADIGVAVAMLFPQFSLTGMVGLQNSNLGNLLSNSSRFWNVGPSINWSLFNGGRVRAGIDLNRARREEAQFTYEKTVLGALSEVESSLLTWKREAEINRSLAAAAAAAQQALKLASGRYRAGLSGMLDLLLSERALYQAQDQLIVSSQRLNVNLVALYKALGGGWKITEDEQETAGRPAKTDSLTATIRAGDKNS
jgi:outer membrane protein, multidrug efflux system